jgi:hypothetical protein
MLWYSPQMTLEVVRSPLDGLIVLPCVHVLAAGISAMEEMAVLSQEHPAGEPVVMSVST